MILRNKKQLFSTILLLFSLTLSIGAETTAETLVAYSRQFLGAPYKYGGKGPDRFDCSGFTSYIFKHFGYELAASSPLQYKQGEKVKLRKVQLGDLVFFKGSNAKSGDVGHVGIVCEIDADKEKIRFIHATTSKGVVIDEYPGLDYYNDRYVGIKRILNEDEKAKEEEQTEEKANEKDETEENEITPNDEQTSEKEEKRKESPGEKTLKKPDGGDMSSLAGNNVIAPPPPHIQKKAAKTRRGTTIHTVKQGETLYRLSQMYGCTVEEIMSMNKLDDYNIKIGQDLSIPKKKKR